jgi:hypothetical protein
VPFEDTESRNRLWKKSLQGLADELGMTLSVCHFPPGTSKWNKIEHRLFCFITKNWRGRPLTSYEVIVNLIANTTTKKGLTVRAALDHRQYETGIAVSDAIGTGPKSSAWSGKSTVRAWSRC